MQGAHAPDISAFDKIDRREDAEQGQVHEGQRADSIVCQVQGGEQQGIRQHRRPQRVASCAGYQKIAPAEHLLRHALDQKAQREQKEDPRREARRDSFYLKSPCDDADENRRREQQEAKAQALQVFPSHILLHEAQRIHFPLLQSLAEQHYHADHGQIREQHEKRHAVGIHHRVQRPVQRRLIPRKGSRHKIRIRKRGEQHPRYHQDALHDRHGKKNQSEYKDLQEPVHSFLRFPCLHYRLRRLKSEIHRIILRKRRGRKPGSFSGIRPRIF